MKFMTDKKADMIFADYVYEDLGFSTWVDKYWDILGDNGIFIAMTDFHSDAEFHVYMKNTIGAYPVSKLCWKNEWGHPPSKNFHMCYDMVLIYSKTPTWKFNRDVIQVPKITAKAKGLNPSGRITKAATAWIDDCALTTGANERVVRDDGKLQRWQKPTKLLHRVMAPFLKDGMLIIDPFAGTGTSGVVARELNCNWIGIEYGEEEYKLAKKRLGL
jgi:DNA modification methylase